MCAALAIIVSISESLTPYQNLLGRHSEPDGSSKIQFLSEPPSFSVKMSSNCIKAMSSLL